MTTLRNPEPARDPGGSGRFTRKPPPRRGGNVTAIMCLLLGAALGGLAGTSYGVQHPGPLPPINVNPPSVEVAAPNVSCPAPHVPGRILSDEDWSTLRGSIDETNASLRAAGDAFRDAVHDAEANLAAKADIADILASVNVARRHLWELMQRPAPTCHCTMPTPIVHHHRHGPRQHCPWQHQENHSTWE